MKIRTTLAGVFAGMLAAILLIAMPGPAHATGTWVWSHPISHTYQDSPANCVPAAFVNQLYSVGVTEDQDTLASQMGTTSSGTTWYPGAAPALNKIVASEYVYTVRVASSAADVTAEMQYEIAAFGSAMVAPTVEGRLPWVNNPSDTNGHDIVVYGYNTGQATDQGGALYAWDPAPGRGYEWVTAQDLFNALQGNNGSSTARALYAFDEEW